MIDDIKAKFKTLNEQYKATDKAQQENIALLKKQYQEYSKTRIELESLEKGTKLYSEKLKQLKEKRDQLKSKMLCIEHLEKNSRVKIIDKEGIVLYEGLEKNEPFGGYNWLFDTESGTYSCYLSDADIITKTIIEEA